MAEPFVERQRLGRPAFVAIMALCAAALGAALFPGMPAAARFGALAGCAALLLVYVELQLLTTIVTAQELLVGFRHLRSQTPLSEIASARPVRLGLWSHGIGIHFSRGAVAFTARTGPGVEIVRKKDRPLVFSSNDPAAVLAALEAAGVTIAG